MGREIKGRTRTPSRGTSGHPSTSTTPPHSPPLPLLSSLLFSLLLSSPPTLTHEPISASRSPPHDNTTPTPTHLSLTAVTTHFHQPTAPFSFLPPHLFLSSLLLFFSPQLPQPPRQHTTSPTPSSQLPLPLPPYSPTSTTTNPLHRSPSLLPTSSSLLFSSFFLLNSRSPPRQHDQPHAFLSAPSSSTPTQPSRDNTTTHAFLSALSPSRQQPHGLHVVSLLLLHATQHPAPPPSPAQHFTSLLLFFFSCQ